MKVTENSNGTFDVQEMTADQAELLAALADFPQWGKQPEQVREFCAALHNKVQCALPNGRFGLADSHGMTNHTTV